MIYETRQMTAAPAALERQRLLAFAIDRLRSSPPLQVERELRDRFGALPLVARGIAQEGMKTLRQSGGAVYRRAEAPRIPGAEVRYHNPQSEKGDAD